MRLRIGYGDTIIKGCTKGWGHPGSCRPFSWLGKRDRQRAIEAGRGWHRLRGKGNQYLSYKDG